MSVLDKSAIKYGANFGIGLAIASVVLVIVSGVISRGRIR